MSLLSKLVRRMYKGARLAHDLEVLTSGNPRRILRRMVNKRLLKHVGGRIRV
jgi:hypothetical protein